MPRNSLPLNELQVISGCPRLEPSGTCWLVAPTSFVQVDSSNYVWTWVAVAVYVLVAIAHKELGIELSPYRVKQTTTVMPFE